MITMSDRELRLVVEYFLPIFFAKDEMALRVFDTRTFSAVLNIGIRTAQYIFKELLKNKIIEPIPDDITKAVFKNLVYVSSSGIRLSNKFVPKKVSLYTLTKYGADVLTDFMAIHIVNSDEFPVQSALNRCVLDLNKAREDPNTVVTDYAFTRLIAAQRKENIKDVIMNEDINAIIGIYIDLLEEISPDFFVIGNQKKGIFVYLLHKDNLSELAESAAKIKEAFNTAIWPASPSYKIEDILRYRSAFTFILDMDEELNVRFLKTEEWQSTSS